MPDGDLEFRVDPPVDDALVEEIVSIWVDVTNAGGAVGFVPPVDPDDILPVARTALERVAAGDAHLVVVRRHRTTAGLAFLIQRPGPLFAHWATIKSFQIHPDHQGHGLGAALLDEVEATARGLGLEQLHLTVRGGTGIENFYIARGYHVVSRTPDIIRLAPGHDVDEIYLRTYL